MPRISGGRRMALTFALLFFGILLLFQNCARKDQGAEDQTVTKLSPVSIIELLAQGPVEDKRAVCETENNYACVQNIFGPGLANRQFAYNTCVDNVLDRTWCLDVVVFQYETPNPLEEFVCFNNVLKEGDPSNVQVKAAKHLDSLKGAVERCKTLLKY